MTPCAHITSALFASLRLNLRFGIRSLLPQIKNQTSKILCSLFLLVAFLISASAVPAGKPTQIPAGKPEIFDLEPRGIQRGTTNRIKLIGTNLIGLTGLTLHNPKLIAELLDAPEATTNVAWIELTASPDLAGGPYELCVKNTNAESSRLKIYIDDLPQAFEASANAAKLPNEPPVLKLPVSFWGVLDPPGDVDEILFEAAPGDSLVFDLAARSIGSKADTMLTLLDERGNVLASNNGLDGGDALLHFQVPSDASANQKSKFEGRDSDSLSSSTEERATVGSRPGSSSHKKSTFRLRITERTDAGSKDHYYRVSIGTFPIVVGHFPLGVTANRETDLQLIGFNLPSPSLAHLKASPSGEIDVPVPPEYRTRRALKVVLNENPELIETEPNDTIATATPITVGSAIDGRIDSRPGQPPDVDTYRFDARRDQTLVIETDAARRGSPIDTKIEVLGANGKPVERLLLQAVRDSHITFRGIDSLTDDLRVENWQEMELNQFMYLQGEVCKIFRMPQGPDSGFLFYNVSAGKRLTYFDTSPVAHALDEPAYIVEPHPPGTVLAANGLPAFTIYYANDDDAERELGSDSRLLFDPPQNGTYFVRVTDTSGSGGERFAYRLLLRPARPDFTVTLSGANPAVNAGAGKDFTVTASRIDGFDGDIRVDIQGLPPGFSVLTPLVIQAGHREAKGTLNAGLDALAPAEADATTTKITATAIIAGQPVTKDVNNLGKITLAPQPKFFVALEPYDETVTNFVERSIGDKPLELTIAPGQSIPAWLKIKRNGHEDLVTFTVESLPHGVIVDNIGLNGVLIPKGQDARQIFFTAAKWVPEVDRLCFAKAAQAEAPTSRPLMLHVRKPTPRLSRTP